MEYAQTHTTDLHIPGHRGPRRPSEISDEHQMLRRRTPSRMEQMLQDYTYTDNQGPFSDEFRIQAPASSSISYQPIDSCGSRRDLGDNGGPGLLDTIPLTPMNILSGKLPVSISNSNRAFPTHIGFPEAQDYLDIPLEQARPEACRTESDGSVYSVGSTATAISSGIGPVRSVNKLGVMEKFTQKWPKPLPLKIPGSSGFLEESDMTESDLRKSVDAALLESGIGGSGGILGLEWFGQWTSFKWCLLFSVFSVLVYGIAGMVCAILTWFRIWKSADVMYVADNDIVILITLASSILIFTSLTGLTGTLLSSRPILAIYALLLFPSLISMSAIGYTAYKRATFALEQKLDMSWSEYYTPLGRLLIQNSLRCCGWSSPMHGGTPSRTCFPRTPLPGCKGPLLRFEQTNLQLVWTTVFALVPMHLVNIIVVMLCANHVTKTFGSGITPKRYRLTAKDVREDAGRVLDLLKGRGAIQEVNRIRRPGTVRAPANTAFREDREERIGLLDGYFDESRQGSYGRDH